MKTELLYVDDIPAILWGEPSDRVYLHVHGKMSRKEYAENFAKIAAAKGMQTLSFDLPEHGERADDPRHCTNQNAMADVYKMAQYAFAGWKHVRLFACSMGAHFAMMRCAEMPFERCLFQSPIANMRQLTDDMMAWFGVTEEKLRAEKTIDTPVSRMYWQDYQYIHAHPVEKWNVPTQILYGSRDNLQSRAVIQFFCDRFGCGLTVSEGSEHPFMAPEDEPIVTRWLETNI